MSEISGSAYTLLKIGNNMHHRTVIIQLLSIQHDALSHYSPRLTYYISLVYLVKLTETQNSCSDSKETSMILSYYNW